MPVTRRVTEDFVYSIDVQKANHTIYTKNAGYYECHLLSYQSIQAIVRKTPVVR